jgi:hypothetical protein
MLYYFDVPNIHTLTRPDDVVFILARVRRVQSESFVTLRFSIACTAIREALMINETLP